MVEPVSEFSHESCCRAILENIKSMYRFYSSFRDPSITIWDREDLLLFSQGAPHVFSQGIEYSDLSEQNADAVIKEVISYFKERNLPFM